MTLGIWMKNYVFYPILRSKLFTNLGKKLRKVLGKKQGRMRLLILQCFCSGLQWGFGMALTGNLSWGPD